MQPDSIRRFSLFYLGSLAVSLLATFVGFDVLLAEVEAQSQASGLALGPEVVLGGIAVNVAITLLLWYLVARKGFVIAKWIVVLLFLFTLVTSVPGILAGGLQVYEAISLAAVALQAVAVFYLFKPDAKAWFSGGRSAAPPTED